MDTEEDKDWLELVAGRDVEGFSEEEKAFYAIVRQQLLKEDVDNNDENIDLEYTEKELTSQREKILKHWEQKKIQPLFPTQNPSEKHKGNTINQKLRTYVVPFALAASVAVIAINIIPIYQYPNISPGFQVIDENRGETLLSDSLVVEQPKPDKMRKKLIRFFLDNDMQYAFVETSDGWKVTFEVLDEHLSKTRTVFANYDLKIESSGFVNLKIIKE